jgi:hypothetical protein
MGNQKKLIMPKFDTFNINFVHLGKVLEAKKENNSLVRGAQKAFYVSKCGKDCPFFSLGNREGYFRCAINEDGRLQKADIDFLSGEEKFPKNCPITFGSVIISKSNKSETI